jgi:hypothetical protein
MSKFINESLNSVLKSDRNCQNTILFISDAAAYMIKTGKLLKAQYPNMLHITRIAHALYILYNICEYTECPQKRRRVHNSVIYRKILIICTPN